MIGVEFKIRTLDFGETIVKLQIWDICGQEWGLPSSKYDRTQGVVVVYDITNPETFQKTQPWFGEIERYALSDVCSILVGNKTDLAIERKVDSLDAKKMADGCGARVIEVSACTGQNIEELFIRLTMDIFKKRKEVAETLPIFDETRYLMYVKYGVQICDTDWFALFCLNMKEESKITNSLLRLSKDLRKYIATFLLRLLASKSLRKL